MSQRISPELINAPQYSDGIIKKVNYEYDLISGNVNKVYYQKGNYYGDQFIHKYNYDADNRITSVETSRDGAIWEKDASYLYYDHEPLAKVIIGDKKVQGTDYAYTLQGWLKTVNSENMATNNKDMGRDGNSISKDAFGYSLSYFNNDYAARNPGTNQAHSVSHPNNIQGTDLYNGNIKRMITSVRGLNEEILPTQINLYSYDQLNRIFDMNSFNGKEVNNSFDAVSSYKSAYTYDKNGNLQTLERDAPKLRNRDDLDSEYIEKMDNFLYEYIPSTNKLTRVNDSVNPLLFQDDIDSQPANNYQYDQIGQLISDTAENIESISWRVDGKVKSIRKYGGAFFINFFYDGLGNRIAKQVSGGKKGTTTSHYTRDAQGNTMAVYDLILNPRYNPEYNLKEHHIYGSSRLGLQEYDVSKEFPDFNRLVGDKRYELSNHLGNVLNVISDRKIVQKNMKLLHHDTFNEDLYWESLNEFGKSFINEQRELQVVIQPLNLSGTTMNLKFNENETVMFNFDLKRLSNFPTSIPINLEIRDPNDKNVIWSSLISSDGVASGSFTPTTTADYLVTLSANNATENEIEFTLDNFYVYVAPASTSDFVSLFLPDVLAYNDYYPFGMLVPNRHESTDTYRYSFQEQEKDDEIKGEGNSMNFTYRMHDPRVGRFFAVDPLAPKYPFYSPYQFSGNRLIDMVELEGLEPANNPKSPGAKEEVGMAIVSGIAGGAAAHNAIENLSTLNPFTPAESFKGTNICKGNDKYIADTVGDPSNQFNMYVSTSLTFKVDESNAKNFNNYEAFVVDKLMQNMVSGTGPENYDFPLNGIISSKFLNSDILKAAITDFNNGDKVNFKQYSFGAYELYKDIKRNNTLYNITGLTGSGTITITPNKTGIQVRIFNITSLTSGTFGKEVLDKSKWPKSYTRDPESTTPYGNISQTFNLFIPHKK